MKQAKAVYGLSSPAEPIFVQWVVDPEKAGALSEAFFGFWFFGALGVSGLRGLGPLGFRGSGPLGGLLGFAKSCACLGKVELNYWLLGNGVLIGSCLVFLVLSGVVNLGFLGYVSWSRVVRSLFRASFVKTGA